MRRALEWFLAIVGSVNGLFVTAAFAQYQLSTSYSIFDIILVPGIYILEIAIISLLPIFSVWRNDEKWLQRLWAGNGALLGLVILGMWSIGAPLIPSLVLSVVLGISISLRQKQSLLKHGITALKFFVFQMLFMLILIWLQITWFAI